MATIRTVQFTHIRVGITVITVTLCNSKEATVCGHSAILPEVDWVSGEQKKM